MSQGDCGPAERVKTVLVLEDHDDTRQWWLEHLADVFPRAEAVGAACLADARECLRRRSFFLALIDIHLPDGSGIDIVREIGRASPETCCIISTIFDDDDHIFTALRAGARGFLTKDQPRPQLLDQLRRLVRGEPPLSPGVARRILNFFSCPAEDAEPPAEELTARERDVLQLIAKGYSRPEAAEILGLSVHTVASYTKVIYQKLNVSRRAEAVMEAMRLGLIRRD